MIARRFSELLLFLLLQDEAQHLHVLIQVLFNLYCFVKSDMSAMYCTVPHDACNRYQVSCVTVETLSTFLPPNSGVTHWYIPSESYSVSHNKARGLFCAWARLLLPALSPGGQLSHVVHSPIQ